MRMSEGTFLRLNLRLDGDRAGDSEEADSVLLSADASDCDCASVTAAAAAVAGSVCGS